MQRWGFVGGRLVAKILVADDNSNIQKMVGLALKDQGIDVVAVGNGEAAVRKISDVKPDLVLADVFMPVRNGYEVCQYVKMDSALSHIPVILLVGAFDPLDEQEAQRVGADGVLKKPFVPPDPLISMVKSALTRAGVAHGTNAPKTAEPEPVKATDFLAPRFTPSAYSGAPVQEAPAQESIPSFNSESFADEVPTRPEPLKIDSGSQPVAFGSLLQTPTEEEQGPTYMVDPELALEHDWREKDDEEKEEEEVEDKSESPWRRDEAETSAETHHSSGVTGWRAGSFEQIKARRSEYEAWEAEQEKPSAVEAAKTAPEVSARPEESKESVPSVPATPAAPAAPLSADPWARAVPANSPSETGTKTSMVVEEATPARMGEPASPQPAATSAPEVTRQEPQQKPASTSWFSTTASPWDAEIEKANKLASTWDATVPALPAPATNKVMENVSSKSDEEAKATIGQASLPPATVEAIREEAAQVTENALEPGSQASSSTANADSAPSTSEALTPGMDDLVAKVLAKMSPEVLQAVTREILKPVVEAMVKEELKSKKS
jgi:CheY-like chemotaxis protein